MRIVTWNCSGALRKKWHTLAPFDADLFVIEECEDPSQSGDAKFREWAGNHLWKGPTKSKGVGVFAREGISLEAVALDTEPLQLFLPCLVDGAPLLATWTKRANSPNFGYIGQLWKFLQRRKNFIEHKRALLIGDLNSNVQWDVWDRWWNHSDVVRELDKLGLRSMYHESLGIPQGTEPHPTFFLHRNTEKPYHIDYVFAGQSWALENAVVGAASDWLAHSDHMPLIVQIS